MAHVLIVDDHKDYCRALIRLLKLRGHSSQCVNSGESALETLRVHGAAAHAVTSSEATAAPEPAPTASAEAPPAQETRPAREAAPPREAPEPPANLVLLDMMMPGMDGLEVLRLLRNNPQTASLPVVMYTAIGDASFAAHALEKGANDYVVKGTMDFDALATRLERYCGPAAGARARRGAEHGGGPDRGG